MDLKSTQDRNKIIQEIRNFFTEKDFIEVETPIMVTIPGMEPHLNPFETTFTNGEKLYLNTSPELQMKKLLARGFNKIFNITKTFRNGEIGGPTHNPEFTMLEWYRKNADYKDIMEDCEKLFSQLSPRFSQSPWRRISTRELFLEKCQIDLLKNQSYEKFKKTAEEKGYDSKGCLDWDDIFFKIFLNHIEKDLGKDRPTIVYDYPSSQAALAKKSAQEPFFAERFELYIDGIELANAFSELTDAQEQHQRMQEEQAQRRAMNKTVFPIDEEFLDSLESLQEPCAGIALGIDRLIMLLLGKKSIEEVIHFPMTKMLNQI